MKRWTLLHLVHRVSQDLSIAGNQAGIHEGTRSSLFFEAIRIIQEMRNATANQFPRFAVWENVCFSGDTLVTCSTGYKKIKSISVGDLVKTHDGSYGTVRLVHSTPRQPTVRVLAGGNVGTVCTNNHPFYVREKYRDRDGKRKFTDPHYTAACELTKDSFIGYKIDCPTLPNDFIDENIAWAVGRWLADGSVDLKKSSPRIFISVGDYRIDGARERINKLPYKIHENKPHKSVTNFVFTSSEFYSYISDAGIGAGQKRVPSYVFQLPIFLQKAILNGYLSGDGSNRKDQLHEIVGSTSSYELAIGIARIMRNVYHTGAGITRHHTKNGCINGRIIKANYDTYLVYASTADKGTYSFFDGEYVWQPVKSVAKTGKYETVYNLSVEGNNTYAANDMVVHNCGALSSNKGADFKAVLEAFCEAAGAEVSLPLPEVNKGKWATAGAIVGDGFSVAWRVYNAVGWGVPQRRERIYLVADFGGERAGEILFVEEGGRRNYETSFQAWKRFASDPEGGAGRSDHGGSVTVLYDARGNGDGKTCPTITGDHENRITDYTAVLVQKVTDE